LGNKEGLLGRVAPYAGVALLGSALIPILNLTADWMFVALVAGLTVSIVTSPWWVPWDRLPYSAQAIPPIVYLAVIALLRDADGGAESGYGTLVALVVMWLAIYGTRAELTAGLVGVGAVFLVPVLAVGGQSYPGSEVGWGVLWLAVSAIIGYTTQGLVKRVRDQAAASQKHAEALREREERFRSFLESAPDGVVIIDSRGSIVLVNAQTERLFDYERSELIGQPVEMLLPEHLREVHGRHRQGFLADPRPRAMGAGLDLHGRRRDGTEFPIDISLSPLETEDGVLLASSIRDITDRKRAEQYFATQHEVTRVLAESGPGENVVPRVLQALAEGMEWEVGEYWGLDEGIQALRCADIWHVPGIDVSKLEASLPDLTFERGSGIPGHVWSEGTPVRIENIVEGAHFLRSSPAVELGLRAAVGLPIKSESRFLGAMVFFSREIRALDTALVEMMSALSAQVGQFIERRRIQDEADRMKDEFFSLVSHEFRTPLTSISGYTELLTERAAELTGEERAHFLDVIKRNSKRLRRLVDDLLFISKVQAGKFSITPREVDLTKLVKQCVEASTPLAEENGLALSLEADEMPPIVGDPDRLGQLLDNLISNAVKYTPEGERVDVSLSMNSNSVVMQVTNTGVYVPPEDRERLFERFFRRSDPSAQDVQGVGLGLTIAKSIVHAHTGKIEVHSTEEVGTTFRVELPLRGAVRSPNAGDREEIAV
jgi:PAS domain S-box-containing protein